MNFSSFSSSNISNFRTNRRVRPSRVESGVLCDCEIEAPCWEAWKTGTMDPERRFFGCSRFRDSKLRCRFFQWADPPYTERAREVIEKLREKLAVKFDEAMVLRNELERAEGRIAFAVAMKDEELKQKEKVVLELKKELWYKKNMVQVVQLVCVAFVLGVCIVTISRFM